MDAILRWRASRGLLLLPLLCAACAESEIDPADLTARDLLGLDPAVAARWDRDERAAARRVLAAGLADPAPSEPIEAPQGIGGTLADRAIGSLEALDHDRAERGEPSPLVARVQIAGAVASPAAAVNVEPIPFDLDAPAPVDPGLVVPRGWEIGARGGWDALVSRDPQTILGIARAAGHVDDTITVEPAARTPFAAIYLPDERLLLVNPVLLAALEQRAGDPRISIGPAADPAPASTSSTSTSGESTGGFVGLINPYNFYGSIGECAAAQRVRCEACLPSMSCEAESRDVDGNTECATLAADDGRGYFLFCTNLALAIDTVADCLRDRSSCPIVTTAGNQISALQQNAAIFDDPACLTPLDACLSDIFGAPEGNFPGPGDGGPGPPPPPPRNVNDCSGQCDADGWGCSSTNCSTDCDSEGNKDCTCGSPDDGCTCTQDSEGGESCACGGGSDSSGSNDSSCACSQDSEGNCTGCSCSESDGDSCAYQKDDSGGSSCSCGSGSGSGSSGSGSGGCTCGSGSSGNSCSKSGSAEAGAGANGNASASGCRIAPARVVSRAGTLLVTIAWGLLPVVVLVAARRRQRP